MFDRWAVLDAAEPDLGETGPARDVDLPQGGAVSGVTPVGGDDMAHMPFVQRGPDRRCFPEGRRHRRRTGDEMFAGDRCAATTAPGRVVSGHGGTARATQGSAVLIPIPHGTVALSDGFEAMVHRIPSSTNPTELESRHQLALPRAHNAAAHCGNFCVVPITC